MTLGEFWYEIWFKSQMKVYGIELETFQLTPTDLSGSYMRIL